MIDLHLHTTASDGALSPAELVIEARAAGIRTLAVTDHDTVAAVAAVAAAAGAAGLGFLTGIEITAVHGQRDAHVLGYGLDPDDDELSAFLLQRRRDRLDRARAIAARLARVGAPIDIDGLLAGREAQTGHAVARPRIAAALVAAGHCASVEDAFARFLAEGRPGYVERTGPTPGEVIARIRRAGGIASLAHPGRTRIDDLIPHLVDEGLRALEVFHPDHGPDDVERYDALARRLGLVATGGSDYHGPGARLASSFGRVGLPDGRFADLAACAASAGRA